VTATLFTDGRLIICESGHWNQSDDERLSYSEWHEDVGTCEPQELLYKLVTEMQDRV
jgi:hypothetical protein